MEKNVLTTTLKTKNRQFLEKLVEDPLGGGVTSVITQQAIFRPACPVVYKNTILIKEHN